MDPLIIGICGGSGSGKTTFLRKIKAYFPEKDLSVLSMDEYYRPIHEQEQDRNGIENFDLPRSVDKKSFVNDIKCLIEGGTVYRPEYTFNNRNTSQRILEIHPAPVIIVEGLFVLHYKKIRKLLDLKIFLHAKENLKVIRRIKRDQVERNYPIEDVLYRYENHVLPTFEKYIKPYSDEADIIINNNLGFEAGLAVVTGYIRDYLAQHHQTAADSQM